MLHTWIGSEHNLFNHNTADTGVKQDKQNEKPRVSGNKPFLVKPYGCGICGGMFEMETDCVEHCYQVCYFPVEDDFATLFFYDEQQNYSGTEISF